MTECSRAKRLAKNTIFLYFRMFIMMAISLYTSRVILNTLGVSDYGIYNVIGGFVAMFTLLSGSLTNAVSRFLTYEIGKSSNHLNLVFSTSLTVMFFLSLIVLLVGETAGYWFLNSKMNIPIDRIVAANWTLQCSLLTFAVNLISVPYNAMIIANEKMLAFTYISIFEAVLKLLIVYLVLLSTCDKLVVYSILLLLVSILIRLLYGVYAKRNFKDSTYHFVYDKQLLKKITNFAGWNFLGSGAAIINIHGVNMLMNLFFGVTVNAARGIATQVNYAVQQFVYNFMIALNPQITKSYAQEDYSYVRILIFRGAKFSFFLMLIFVIPLCVETEIILKWWLNIVPQYAIPFVQWTLITSLVTILTSTMITGLHATGKIKKYMIIVGGIECMNFPITYVFFKIGYMPMSAYYIYFITNVILIFLRIYLVKDLLYFRLKDFFCKVIFRCTLVSLTAPLLPLIIRNIQSSSFLRCFEVFVISFLSTVTFVYMIGIDKKERIYIKNYIRNFYYKMRAQI